MNTGSYAGQPDTQPQADKPLQAPDRPLRVKVPCSTANIGPGFDCLGLALNLYLHVEARFNIADPSIPLVEQCGTEGKELPCGRTNPLWQILAKHLPANTLAGLRLKVSSDIPTGRGLGSSAAIATAAATIIHFAQGRAFNKQDIFQAAAELEGHPDNAAACVFGNFTVSGIYENKVNCKALPWPPHWQCLLVSPDYELPTSTSRSALPQQIGKEDAVFNLQHLAALVAAVATADQELFTLALQDRLHQPYRQKLVPELPELQQLCASLPVLGCALSGAGPSILIVCADAHVVTAEERLEQWQAAQNKPYVLRLLEVDQQGVTTY